MFTDIFSSFDPMISSSSLPLPLPLFWMLSLLLMLPILSSIWLSPTHLNWTLFLPLTTIMSQLSRSRAKQISGWNTIVAPLFLFLILSNLAGMAPYTFSTSSHLIFTFSFGLTLWLSLILSSALFSPMKFIAALLPGGAPSWLNPFLVLIESSSISVRPITLSFRLAANMSAGHIVIMLIAIFSANAILTSLTTFILILLPSQMAYIMFELGICLIQAFIFCLLLSLYANEHP